MLEGVGSRNNSRMSSIRIGFVLLSNSHHPQPSTRISVLNVLPHLRAAGFVPSILHDPADDCAMPDLDHLDIGRVAAEHDIVYFQKVHGPSVLRAAAALKRAGVATVYGACDDIEPSMIEATDATVLVTEFLRSVQPRSLHAKIHVVHDGIENPGVFKREHADHVGTPRRPLRAVLVASAALTRLPVIGTPPPWLTVTIVGRYPPHSQTWRRLRHIRWEFARQQPGERREYLSFLLGRGIERVAWDPVDVYTRMLQADVGIIPIETLSATDPRPAWMLKSENRLTMKMALGLPVIATPIPSYEPVVRPGVDALFARSPGEWLQHLQTLRDPVVRRTMGRAARESVLRRYSKEEQAHRLIAVLRLLVAPAPVPRPTESTPR